MMKPASTKARGAASPAWHEEFRAWVIRCAEGAEVIINIRPMRTSSDSVTLWKASATTSFAAADRSDSDVCEAMDVVGFDVVRRDAIGASKRRELGDRVFVLQMRHAPGGRGKREIGVALHVGKTIFIYLLASARANNLDAATKDRAGNAATEIIATVVREVAEVGLRRDPDHRPHVHAREHARIVRDEQHGADLKATFRACRVIAHTPHTTDMLRPSEAQSFSFGSMMSAAAAEAAVQGMSRADVVIQANGGFNTGIKQVPFTHGPLVRHEVDAATATPVVTTDIHQLSPVADLEEARRQLRLLVDTILVDRWDGTRDQPGTNWVMVGNLMAELGHHSRKPSDMKDGRRIPLASLPEKARGRAAKTLFGTRWISGWRHGYFERIAVPKADMELDLSNLEHVSKMTTDDGRIGFKVRIRMPIPDGGWGITADEWDEVVRRRHPRRGQTRVYTGHVLPLAGMSEWEGTSGNAARQYDIATKSKGYVLRSRPISEARRLDGTRRGWEDCDFTREAGVSGSDLHADLGRAIGEALLRMEASTVPVVLTPARPQPTATQADPARARSDVKARLERAEQQRRGAADARNAAKGKHEDEGTDDSADELNDAQEDLDRATAQVRTLRAELRALDAVDATENSPALAPTDNADDSNVLVETAKPEFVAVALQKCVGKAPGWLQEACQVLLTDLRMEPHETPGSRRMVRWTATLNLHTIDSVGKREVVTVPLAGEVRDRTNARGGSAMAHGPEAWAWAFFYRGEDFATIGTTAGIDGSGKKNSYLYKGLAEWLTLGDPAPVPNTHMRTAALDCPIPGTRRVLWSAVTGDTSALTGIDAGFVQHIRDTYSSTQLNPRWAWCKDTHTLARAAATIMLERGGSANIYELAQALNVPHTKLLNLALVNGKPIKGSRANNPAATAVSPFTKNWSRGGTWLPAEERELSLRPCPHANCPERLRGGSPFASHVLIVPETEGGHGVLCPDCRRLPILSMAHVRFPADYIRPWRGRYGHGSHAGARDHRFSHIDPALPDPGVSAAPPDTGTQPRPETMVSKPGNYAAKRLQKEPMAGHRLLPHGLTEEEHSAVSAEVERLGGRLAVKVTETLEYVVVADRRTASRSEIAARAAKLGAEILTLAQFKARAERNWRTPGESAA